MSPVVAVAILIGVVAFADLAVRVHSRRAPATPLPPPAPAFGRGTRVQHGHRTGRIAMEWVDGKWAVQLAGDPRGSYTLLLPGEMTVLA